MSSARAAACSARSRLAARPGLRIDGGKSGIVMVGGERTVRRNLKLMTENYVWKEGNGLVSGGVRLFGERLSADFGLVFPVGMGEFFGFPIVNVVYVF